MTFTLDIAQFGTGIGLVLIGWAAGLVVSYIFNITAILSTLGGKG
ncbi:MAG: hypothetical protein OEV64_04920 [Desulfobulbaceae bacterium]|nr:hypothetical protein [Desulfobulbaceae bacterium]